MSRYTVTRSTTVDAPPERVLPLLLRFPAWREWSPFEGSDPDLHRDYRGAEQGVGAVYEWSGNAKAGAGIMTITDATDDQVRVHLQFLKPFRSVSEHTFDLVPAAGSTTVTWTMTGEQTGLTGLLMRLMMPMEKAMGPEFERGLAALKAAAEG